MFKAILFLFALMIIAPDPSHAVVGALKSLGGATSSALEKNGEKIKPSTEQKAVPKPEKNPSKQQNVQSAQQVIINKLIGVWESPDTTKGGLGTIYEFREDGGLMAGVGALVNSTYDPQDPNLHHFMIQPDDKNGNGDSRPEKIMDGPAGSPSYVDLGTIPAVTPSSR